MSLLGLTLPALTFALSIDRVLNGLTRPFFGWVSDQIGRENTMFIAFGLEAVGIWALSPFGHDPVLFVMLSGLVFFAWGEIYSLFPVDLHRRLRRKFATTNAGLLYTAKGTASLLVPLGSVLTAATGSWHAVFCRRGHERVAAVMALAVLKPMRTAHQAAYAADGRRRRSRLLPLAPGLLFQERTFLQGDRAIQWKSDPWTDNQVTLAMVAIFLAICCLIILTIDQLHNHIIAQASERGPLVTHLLYALGS